MLGKLIFWAFFIAFVALVYWLFRKNQQIAEKQSDQFEEAAKKNGWRYSHNPRYSTVTYAENSSYVRNEIEDIQFEFTGGLGGRAWRMWYDSNRRANKNDPAQSAIWLCEGVRARELSILILPRWRYRFESGRIMTTIASAAGAAAQALGTDVQDTRQEFFKRAVELRPTDRSFADAFIVLSGTGATGDWLDEAMQVALTQWPTSTYRPTLGNASFELSFGAHGLRLEYQRPADDQWAFWDKFGQLGVALANRLENNSAFVRA
jgi:hypothetical protein